METKLRIDTLIAAEMLQKKNILRNLVFSGAKTQTISHAP